MKLKQLNLSGFKSFAKKNTLEFTSPVTAIVGPNGSGKSNLVEAVRFVLGEQKMKTLRGKSGADLIFKGSQSLPSPNRAAVSITFDNTQKKFRLGGDGQNTINLDYDEITIKREVFKDGGNKYSINGSEVRLKDIVELLGAVNMGASGHHIISQGEADRILNASTRERREMIEDALGLKIYQYRIRESERKLMRTEDNLKEIRLLRREIVPHIKYLKRQVEKLEKTAEMRKELESLYNEYLKREEVYINDESSRLESEKNSISERINEIERELEQTKPEDGVSQKSESHDNLEAAERKILEIRSLRDELSRKLGRMEGMVEMEEQRLEDLRTTSDDRYPFVSPQELNVFVADLEISVENALKHKELQEIQSILGRIQELVSQFSKTLRHHAQNTLGGPLSSPRLEEMRETKNSIILEITNFEETEQSLYEDISRFKKQIEEEKEQQEEKNKRYYELLMKKRELSSERELLNVKEAGLDKTKRDFEEELQEAHVLVGESVNSYTAFVIETEKPREKQEEQRRNIERIKIRLEDSGVGGGEDVIKEYKEVTERDEFLTREIEDLNKSIDSLVVLIKKLKENLDKEFRIGIQKINKQFKEFFILMFGGGSASLSVIEEKKRRYKREDEEILEDEEEEETETGIDIAVSVPGKKAKELQVLSGGERSLTSIALLFALSQVNPPPFLILDETDAALDEANSRKYGDMVERLSKISQLILVTHNRETMSRAHVLYGVTIGSDGGSKLLSVKFGEAQAYAK